MPKAIRFDNGKEFLNAELESWCAQQGIEIQTTVPYSPSQNGIAECMNRTIVELVRAMINSNQLPQFLWENAVAHAVYVCNRAFTKPLGLMNLGSNRGQMSHTYENLGHLYGFYYKAKKSHLKCYRNPIDVLMLAMMTDQIPFYTIMPKLEKSLNLEIFAS